MKRGLFLTASAAASGAAALAATGAAEAQLAPFQFGIGLSNQNLRQAHAQLGATIADLTLADADYQGRRIDAVAKFQVASKELEKALRTVGANVKNQSASDSVLRNAASQANSVLAALNGDANDYGGHKGKAAEALRQGIDFINEALHVR